MALTAKQRSHNLVPSPLNPPDDEHSNVACPHCGASVGKPVRVATRKADATSVDVTMGCQDCKTTWIVQKLTHDEPPA
jgi:hypothetical protein